VPGRVVLGLVAAVLLNRALRIQGLFRVAFYMPSIISSVIIALMWRWMLSNDVGIVNTILEGIGIPGVDWLGEISTAMPSIGVIKIWQRIGYFAVIFLAGLQTIPKELYESAVIDGASAWQKFRYITVPLLNPIMVLTVVLTTLWALQLFAEPLVLTGGGPFGSTKTVVMHLYERGFGMLEMGYAAAIGLTLSIVMLAFTLVERRLLEREILY
jgi:multiple sugar transport system permease protein